MPSGRAAIIARYTSLSDMAVAPGCNACNTRPVKAGTTVKAPESSWAVGSPAVAGRAAKP